MSSLHTIPLFPPGKIVATPGELALLTTALGGRGCNAGFGNSGGTLYRLVVEERLRTRGSRGVIRPSRLGRRKQIRPFRLPTNSTVPQTSFVPRLVRDFFHQNASSRLLGRIPLMNSIV